MFKTGQMYGVDYFAIEEIQEKGFELNVTRMNGEEFRSEMEYWLMTGSRFWGLDIRSLKQRKVKLDTIRRP
jgi:hypothetical protein